MDRHKWIYEVILVLAVLFLACKASCAAIVWARNETVCHNHGYWRSVEYQGEYYCFGLDGSPSAILVSELD